jgi:hypothetical protein
MMPSNSASERRATLKLEFKRNQNPDKNARMIFVPPILFCLYADEQEASILKAEVYGSTA